MAKAHKKAMIHIVGAGLAGLACAVKLAESGHGDSIALYEAAPHAGGRCRSYHDNKLGCVIDNGNHLLLRANHAALDYIRTLKTTRCFHRFYKRYRFADARSNQQWSYRPPLIPKGMRIIDIWRLTRLVLSGRKKRVGDIFPQESSFNRLFIEPLCTAMLNTHPSEASAQLFRHCLWRLLMPSASAYLQAKVPLSDALISPALTMITQQGGTFATNQRLTGGEADGDRLTKLIFSRQNIMLGPRDLVVFALPPEAVTQLIPITVPEQYNQIINVHFHYDTSNLTAGMLGISNSPAQWVFIKGDIISTTTSDAENSEINGLLPEEKAQYLWRDVSHALNIPASPLPPYRLVNEKRATFAATPKNLAVRPAMITRYHNLALAGDWLQSDLPATIEAAIQSGNNAADWCLKKRTKTPT